MPSVPDAWQNARMGDWADFFVAPDDLSAAEVKGFSPRRVFPTVPVGDYDPADAAAEWEGLLTGDDPRELMRRGEPRVLTEITNDGHYVFVVSERLRTLLATTEPRRLAETAAEWSRLRRADGEAIGEADAVAHLADLAALARTAVDQKAGLYCSVR
ncbi:hypothetical protein ACWEMW_14655 [Streptomyces sp. NPDC004684]